MKVNGPPERDSKDSLMEDGGAQKKKKKKKKRKRNPRDY